MSKRTTFTTITPLPLNITRQVVIDFLHDHEEMIDLNPLVKERHPIKPPAHATPEEYHCTWWSLTDRISYLPGGLANGDVTYTCAFHDIPNGLQTHCYAPAGLNIRDKWTINGHLPGEPVEPVELGIGAPITGLYIREDVDMKCNVVMTGFVKKTLKKSHAALVERLKVKAQIAAVVDYNSRLGSSIGSPASSAASTVSAGLRSSSPSWTSVPTSMSSPASSMHMSQAGSTTPPYQSPPYASSTSSSGFSSPASQYSGTSPPPQQYTHSSPHPQNQPYLQRLHHPIPSPPQYRQQQQQHPSPPPYQSSSFPEQQQQRQQQQQQQQQQQRQPTAPEATDLHPSPLRLPSSKYGAPIYRETSGRVTWAALKSSVGTVRYRVAHPDYPQMNPYSEMGMGLGMGSGATLQGPFVAELEG